MGLGCRKVVIIIYTHACTKLVVPSIGSIIHVGLSVSSARLPEEVPSSPMKLQNQIALKM